MKKVQGRLVVAFFSSLLIAHASAYSDASQDTITIQTLDHSAICFKYKGLIIYADPNASYANYDSLPKADIIFITHSHSDHYDTNAIKKIKKDSTLLVCPKAVKNMKIFSGTIQVMDNSDSTTIKGIPIKAVPAYNITTSTLHLKGAGNGYVLTFGQKRIYFAGDTDLIPEMDSLGIIDIAFIPMNIEYVGTDSIVAEAARMIEPSILYLYHFGTVDTSHLRTLLVDKTIIMRMGVSVCYESDKRLARTLVKGDWEKKRIPFQPNAERNAVSNPSVRSGAIISLFDSKGRVMQKRHVVNNKDWMFERQLMGSGIYFVNFPGAGQAAKKVNSETIK
jgi:L-ascorbate metabolism protein UlaG (beta-lactamase superfamily)